MSIIRELLMEMDAEGKVHSLSQVLLTHFIKIYLTKNNDAFVATTHHAWFREITNKFLGPIVAAVKAGGKLKHSSRIGEPLFHDQGLGDVKKFDGRELTTGTKFNIESIVRRILTTEYTDIGVKLKDVDLDDLHARLHSLYDVLPGMILGRAKSHGNFSFSDTEALCKTHLIR